ncbi:hypothetical protein MKW94_028179 [Papaver nudicaule]|uniref:Transmembrane protein n=1 Tax=Papaver nudicaule TaxID=74823 RepID=A0AA42AZ66_PAPNU|nr:hypothetical protein [Papaver nudicaule]
MVQSQQKRVSRRNKSVLISALITFLFFGFSFVCTSAEPFISKLETRSSGSLYYRHDQDYKVNETDSFGHVARQLLGKSEPPTYRHKWPAMKVGWRIIVGTIVGFFGAAFGSVGGVGGGGIYVPMLTLVIGFDSKTSVPISKCKNYIRVLLVFNFPYIYVLSTLVSLAQNTTVSDMQTISRGRTVIVDMQTIYKGRREFVPES